MGPTIESCVSTVKMSMLKKGKSALFQRLIVPVLFLLRRVNLDKCIRRMCARTACHDVLPGRERARKRRGEAAGAERAQNNAAYRAWQPGKETNTRLNGR